MKKYKSNDQIFREFEEILNPNVSMIRKMELAGFTDKEE